VYYGISTAAYRDLPLADALERIADLAPLAEVRCEGQHDLAEPLNLRAAVAAREAGLRLTVHGPFREQPIWSRFERQRRAAVADHRRRLELAAAAGAETYVLHPDYREFATPYDPTIVARLKRTFAELAPLQAELGLRIAVENMPGVGNSHLALPGLDLGELSLAVDVGHAHLSGCVAQMIAQAGIVHWHLQDNFGHGDDPHLAVGRGGIDWRPVLLRVRETVAQNGATVVLEVASERDVLDSLDYLEEIEQGLPAEPAA
jgi:sugar phosphate isomerase/epimerase